MLSSIVESIGVKAGNGQGLHAGDLFLFTKDKLNKTTGMEEQGRSWKSDSRKKKGCFRKTEQRQRSGDSLSLNEIKERGEGKAGKGRGKVKR